MNFIQNIINTFEKLKLCGLNVFPWQIHLDYYKTSLLLSKRNERCILLKNQYQYFRNFKLFYYVGKKTNSNYLINALVIIFSSCADVIFSEDFTLLDRRGFTVFQNLLLLSITSFSFKFP